MCEKDNWANKSFKVTLVDLFVRENSGNGRKSCWDCVGIFICKWQRFTSIIIELLVQVGPHSYRDGFQCLIVRCYDHAGLLVLQYIQKVSNKPSFYDAVSDWRLSRDRKRLKFLVLFLLLADTINTVFDLIYVYDALIINFSKSALHYLLALLKTRQIMRNIYQKLLGVRLSCFFMSLVSHSWSFALLSLCHRARHDRTSLQLRLQLQTWTSRFYIRVSSLPVSSCSLHGA